MNQQNTMMAYNVAQNPAAQQMLQQFMQNNGQTITNTPAAQMQTTKLGEKQTLGGFAKHSLLNPMTDPGKALQQKDPFSRDSLGNDWDQVKSDAGLGYGKRLVSPTTTTEFKSTGLQNNAPQIDWTQLLNSQQQQPIL